MSADRGACRSYVSKENGLRRACSGRRPVFCRGSAGHGGLCECHGEDNRLGSNNNSQRDQPGLVLERWISILR
jgi:hypothetical protein